MKIKSLRSKIILDDSFYTVKEYAEKVSQYSYEYVGDMSAYVIHISEAGLEYLAAVKQKEQKSLYFIETNFNNVVELKDTDILTTYSVIYKLAAFYSIHKITEAKEYQKIMVYPYNPADLKNTFFLFGCCMSGQFIDGVFQFDYRKPNTLSSECTKEAFLMNNVGYIDYKEFYESIFGE